MDPNKSQVWMAHNKSQVWINPNKSQVWMDPYSPQWMCLRSGTAVVPSQGESRLQVAASPVRDLILLPGHRRHVPRCL